MFSPQMERLRCEARALIALAKFELLLAVTRRDILRIKASLANRFATAPSLRAYNPEQPRVPAGNPDGGEWTKVFGGEAVPRDDETNALVAERTEVAADGHHFVPRALFEKENLSPETRRVFEDAKTGRLYGGPHYYDAPHRIYNQAVAEHYQEFLRSRGLRPEELTPSHARQFAESIRNSSDPRIRDFNLHIYRREVWYWIRRLRLRE